MLGQFFTLVFELSQVLTFFLLHLLDIKFLLQLSLLIEF